MAISKQKIWWDALSQVEQDCINHTFFYKRVFDLDEAYEKFSNKIK